MCCCSAWCNQWATDLGLCESRLLPQSLLVLLLEALWSRLQRLLHCRPCCTALLNQTQ